METILLSDVLWAVRDPEVWVTFVMNDEDGEFSAVLVTRKHPPVWPPLRPVDVSFLLSVTSSGDVWINGQRVDLGDELPTFLGMTDEVREFEAGEYKTSLAG